MPLATAQSPDYEGFKRTGVWLYVPTNEEDRRVAASMNGARLCGSVSLLSGATLPAPRKGFEWRVLKDGAFKQESRN